MLAGPEWWPFAAGLTVIGVLLTVLLWRRRGPGPGIKAAGATLLPGAVVLLGLQNVLWALWRSVFRFVVHFVFSPTAWAGLVLGAVGILALIAGGRVQARTRRVAGSGRPKAAGSSGRKQVDAKKPAKGEPSGLEGIEGMDDIEEILRKRGIS